MAVTAAISLGRNPFVGSDSSLSREGDEIQRKSFKAWSETREWWGRRCRDSEINAQLDRLASQKGLCNWDGYGASALDEQSMNIAKDFLYLLPDSIPLPTFAVDPDGEVSFDWIGRDGWELTISFSPLGVLSYSAFFGELRNEHGQDNFQDEVPREILAKIEKVCISASA